MALDAARGTAVIVGNLPADATEQLLIAEFSTVGAVSNVKLAFDAAPTGGVVGGAHRGFGLIYFVDADTAALAVRRLNRASFRGRTLRVALAEDAQVAEALVAAAAEGADTATAVAGVCAGPKALTTADHVAIVESAVDLLTHQQRVELLAQIKVFAQHHPHHAAALLLQNPQLAHLLLHCEVLFDLVQTTDIAQVTAAQQQQSVVGVAPPPHAHAHAHAAAHVPPSHHQHALPPPHHQHATPPVAAAEVVLPPGLTPAQQQQLQYFLSLSAADLAQLPAAVQEQVRMLRSAAVRR